MANFFDDDAEVHQDNTHKAYARRQSGDEDGERAAGPGPSRRFIGDDGDDHDDGRRSPSLPPPLLAGGHITTTTTTTSSNDKGKSRAVPQYNNSNDGHIRHARASSTMSIDLDMNTRNRGGGANTTRRRRDRGFLADGDDDGHDYDDDNEVYETNRRSSVNQDQVELDGDNLISSNDESDIQHLMRLYMNERMSPEILKFPEELITSLMQNLEAQVGYILFFSLFFILSLPFSLSLPLSPCLTKWPCVRVEY